MALARRLPQRPVGGMLRVLADDPAAVNDIPAWCRLRGREYAGSPATAAFDVDGFTDRTPGRLAAGRR